MDAIFVGTLYGVFKVARSNGDWRVASKDFAKKLKDGKAAVFTIWFSER